MACIRRKVGLRRRSKQLDGIRRLLQDIDRLELKTGHELLCIQQQHRMKDKTYGSHTGLTRSMCRSKAHLAKLLGHARHAALLLLLSIHVRGSVGAIDKWLGISLGTIGRRSVWLGGAEEGWSLCWGHAGHHGLSCLLLHATTTTIVHVAGGIGAA